MGALLSWSTSCLGWNCNLKMCHASCLSHCIDNFVDCFLFASCVWFLSIDERAEGFQQEYYFPYLEESASATSLVPTGEHLPLLPIFYAFASILYSSLIYAMLVSSHESYHMFPCSQLPSPTYEPLFDVLSLASRMHA